MSRTLVDNKHEVGGRLGDAWVAPDSRRDVAPLTRIPDTANVAAQFMQAATALMGAGKVAAVEQLLSFKSDQIVVIGPDLQKRARTELLTGDGDAFVILRRPSRFDSQRDFFFGYDAATDNYMAVKGADCEYLLFPAKDSNPGFTLSATESRARYAVPCPYGLTPMCLVAPGGDHLVLGVDFWLSPGVLVFKRSPALLFPSGQILLLGGTETVPHLLNYTLQVDDLLQAPTPIAAFFREQQSIRRYEQAIAVAAGLQLFPVDDVIAERRDHCASTLYVMASGNSISVPYPHSRFSIGASVSAGQVIGGVKVSHGDRHGWHRTLDWSAGLDLGYLCPVSGIVLSDRLCHAYVDSTTGGNYHVRIDLPGVTPAAQDAFWSYVKDIELQSGYFLNSVIGLTPGDVKSVNPLDLWFQYLLSSKAVVVTLNLPNFDVARLRAKQFATENKLIGVITIVQDLTP